MKMGPGKVAWVSVMASLLLGATSAGAQAPAGRDYVKDPLQLLLDCQAEQAKVTGFTATLTKHECIDGRLRDPETMFLKCRYSRPTMQPFSVYMKWTKNPNKDREVIYVGGENDDKVIGHQPVGPMNFELKSDPDGAEARKESLRPITQVGFKSAIDILVKVTDEARAAGDLSLVCIDNQKYDDRPCWMLVRVLPKKPNYPAHVCYAYIDKGLMAPVRIAGFDWDDNLFASYSYGHVKLNVRFTANDFSRDNKEYNWPVQLFGKFKLGEDKRRR